VLTCWARAAGVQRQQASRKDKVVDWEFANDPKITEQEGDGENGVGRVGYVMPARARGRRRHSDVRIPGKEGRPAQQRTRRSRRWWKRAAARASRR
jgi:hypothetical protein